jgi:hypothetical protein
MFYVDNLFFSTEMSLGDAFVLNGAVHHFASLCKTLYLPSNEVYFDSIECLYKDWPHIKVVRTPEYQNMMTILPNAYHLRIPHLYYTTVRVTNNEAQTIAINWERQNYENLGIPYSIRYTGAHIPEYVEGAKELKEELTGGDPNYAVVGRYMQGENIPLDFNITQFTGDLKVVEIVPGLTKNLLQYVDLIRGAKQIHVIPSSIHALVDSMWNQVTPNLFFHHIRKNYVGQINSLLNQGRWMIVNYHVQF